MLMTTMWTRYTLSSFWSCGTWASENQTVCSRSPSSQARRAGLSPHCLSRMFRRKNVWYKQLMFKHFLNIYSTCPVFWGGVDVWVCGYCEEEIEAGIEVFSPISSSQTLTMTLIPYDHWCESSHFLLWMLLPSKLVVMIDWSLGIRS